MVRRNFFFSRKYIIIVFIKGAVSHFSEIPTSSRWSSSIFQNKSKAQVVVKALCILFQLL